MHFGARTPNHSQGDRNTNLHQYESIKKELFLLKFYKMYTVREARDRVVGWGNMLKPEGRRSESRIRWIFSIYVILLVALWPWGRLSLQQKWGYQEFSRGIKSGRGVGLKLLPPSVSRKSENVEASTSRNTKGFHGLNTGRDTSHCGPNVVNSFTEKRKLVAYIKALESMLIWVYLFQ
jgi:hypothetical protein